MLHGTIHNLKRATFTLSNDLLSALSALTLLPAKEVGPAAEMEKLNFLLNAARQLNAGGAIQEILRAPLQLSIQLTKVERGFVFLREENGMRMALGPHANGRSAEEDSTVSRRAMQQAIESESKFSISDTLADNKAASWESVLVNAIRTIYCLPLHNGLLAESEQKASIAAQQLAVAAKIHASLMAITLPSLPSAVLQARSVPSLEIGGYFYDVVALDDCVCIAIADVSGKGVPASIVAATLQGILHAQAMTGQGLAEIASLINRFLCSRNVGKYATMVLLKLYPDGFLELVNCGHVPPVIISESGVHCIEESNLIVGLIPEATYAATQYRMRPPVRRLRRWVHVRSNPSASQKKACS